MTRSHRLMTAVAALAATLVPVSANAGVGDLLVAPTRIVLTNGRGTEVLLNNIGEEEATYRVSAELRRMTPDGQLIEVEDPTEAERLAQEMIYFAPRRVTLPPGQPQAIRIAARAPQGLADGEYRVHLLFRAIPKPRPVEKREVGGGMSFRLIPVYGVSIPVIVRFGQLEVDTTITDVRTTNERAIEVDLKRAGDRSTYGAIEITKDGEEMPIAEIRGIALYTEIADRTVKVPVRGDYQGTLSGPVKVTYREHPNDGGAVIAAYDAVLP
ncbi:molecular chaperone [Sphingomicrobium nitratireducens]|uniref:molecular chaperone n=1 Tax=Sphingomicrobium nitratireducens TaxID=2964666 RepID=UPI00223F9A30|nr:molecular chaperone [Sphingomicrobium nitratireducens]